MFGGFLSELEEENRLSLLIKESYLSREDCLRYREFLDTYLKQSPREGILAALGYTTSREASLVSAETGVVLGDASPINKEIGALFDRIKKDAGEHFSHELDLCQSSYQLMTKGGKNPLHADTIHLDGTPIQADGTPEETEWSGLLYLSDHGIEFEGGVLSFPGLEFDYYPRMGDLVIFRGDIEHRHEVTEVQSGERRNIVFFWGRKGNVSDGKTFFDY